MRLAQLPIKMLQNIKRYESREFHPKNDEIRWDYPTKSTTDKTEVKLRQQNPLFSTV